MTYHDRKSDSALEELHSSPEGLTEAEAARRLGEEGKNALYKEFADANVTSTPADYTELEGQELIDYLKKTV